jgi:hypothetical protein
MSSYDFLKLMLLSCFFEVIGYKPFMMLSSWSFLDDLFEDFFVFYEGSVISVMT